MTTGREATCLCRGHVHNVLPGGDDCFQCHCTTPPGRETTPDDDGFPACPEPTCSLYGKAVMADHPHLDTPAARRRRASGRPVWHVITGPDILALLRRAAAGEDPEVLYLEEYVNADRENVEGTDE